MIKILMIEDDLELAEMLIGYLAKFKIDVKNIDSPYVALSTLDIEKFDLVILDLTLPDMDGLDVCREILSKRKIPIIISSARSDITDKVTSLKMGADDYLPKPYDPRELEARISSVLRRSGINFELKEEEKRDFILDEAGMQIIFNNTPIQLTNAEFGILSYLIKKRGFVISREELVSNVLEISEDSTNKSIDVIVSRIRNKLNDNPKSPKYIFSIRGIGYKLAK
jgi:two-component system OmpR family response regulator